MFKFHIPMRKILFILMLYVANYAAAQTNTEAIPYPSVATALDSLKSKHGANVTTNSLGWTIISDEGGYVVWSFTPAGHPAYPTAVRRAVVADPLGNVIIETRSLCQADKPACDQLMQEFSELDIKARQFAADKLSEKKRGTSGVPVEPGNQKSARDQEVEDLTLKYLSQRDERKYADAYAMLTPAQQKNMSVDKWSEIIARFNDEAGAVIKRRLTKVRWFKDPPGAPTGNYAAVEYSSVFANISVHCGYVVWHDSPGMFRLSREDESFVDVATAKKLSPKELARAAIKLKCD